MRSTFASLLLALAARNVAAHATFQQLWVNGVDFGAQCARLPLSNSPVTDVSSTQMRCNSNSGAVGRKCPVPAGGTVTVEMHQQNGDRSCSNEAIGGAHYGPVAVYLSKVADASKADGSAGWFKIFEDGWGKKSGSSSGDDDYWGTKDLNTCCGKMNVPIPSSLAPGDYLLRAEALALHAAQSSGGGQFYMTCFQITITGTGGSASPPTVQIPGFIGASHPGVAVNIHTSMSSYSSPGPAVWSGGLTKKAGSACTGCESTCKAGSGPSGTAPGTPAPTGGNGGGGDGGDGGTGCTVAKYGQCGGQGYTGCTNCQSGSSCIGVSAPYYYQCA
ncbi:hypothetical protein RB594_008516 [Gaeumannomyces avenae]